MNPKDPTDLSPLRERIDAIDDRILHLLRERMDVVREVAEAKRHARTAIRDPRRERQLVEARRRRADALGLSADAVEAIYHQVMLASRDYQASLTARAATDDAPRRVVVLGGRGAMGRLMVDLFEAQGHTVKVVDRGPNGSDPTDPRTADISAVEAADVVVVSVPIAATEEVIRQVGPRLRPQALLMDVTSIKGPPVAAMLEATANSGAEVVGTHPMFGPGVSTLAGRRVILCRGRGDRGFTWAQQLFEARGLLTTVASTEEHDRAMALVQVLNHFQTQVFGLALSRLPGTLADSLRYTSPAYLMELYTMARHFGQDPALYAAIEMRNPESARMTSAFCSAAAELAAIIEAGDVEAFCRVFDEVRDFLGDFVSEASEQSRLMLDMLAERSAAPSGVQGASGKDGD